MNTELLIYTNFVKIPLKTQFSKPLLKYCQICYQKNFESLNKFYAYVE